MPISWRSDEFIEFKDSNIISTPGDKISFNNKEVVKCTDNARKAPNECLGSRFYKNFAVTDAHPPIHLCIGESLNTDDSAIRCELYQRPDGELENFTTRN